MNVKRYLATSIVAFAFIFAFDFFWHGHLLMSAYEGTASLWRSEQDMQTYFPVMLASQILSAFLVVFLFTRNYEAKGLGEGIRFGGIVGVIFGVMQASAFAYMPITQYIAGMWFLGGVLTGLGVGLVCSFVYRD